MQHIDGIVSDGSQLCNNVRSDVFGAHRIRSIGSRKGNREFLAELCLKFSAFSDHFVDFRVQTVHFAASGLVVVQIGFTGGFLEPGLGEFDLEKEGE